MNNNKCANCIYNKNCGKSFCMQDYKKDYYFTYGFIPENRRGKQVLFVDNDGSDIAAFTRLSEIEKDITNFVNEGKNLYIYSNNTGNGKTSWATRLAVDYVNGNWLNKPMHPIVLFISVPKFLLELKANISNKSNYIESILPNISSCDLVVWDDIGSKNGTEFEVSHLLSIIDQRINDSKSNIYTSNLHEEDLHQLLGDRLYSRVYNYSECIEIKGMDKRGIR